MSSYYDRIIEIFSGKRKTEEVIARFRTSKEVVRVKTIQTYKDFFNSEFYSGPNQDPSQVDDNDSDLKAYINLCLNNVVKSVQWLVGKPPLIEPAYEGNFGVIDELIKEIKENSGGDQFFLEAVTEGSISGTLFLHPRFDRFVNDGEGGILVDWLQTENTFPEFMGTGSNVGVRQFFKIDEFKGEDGEVYSTIEHWDEDYVTVYPPHVPEALRFVPELSDLPDNEDSLSEYIKDESVLGPGVAQFENPYGEVPLIHAKNLEMANSYYGRSDIHDLYTLNKLLNKAFNGLKKGIEYQGFPIIIIKGAKVDKIIRMPGQVWSNIPSNADISTLKLPDAHEPLDALMKKIELASGYGHIPAHLNGVGENNDAASQSFASRMFAMLPLQELTNRKSCYYRPAFKKSFEMAIRFVDKVYKLNLKILNKADDVTEERLDTDFPHISTAARKKIKKLREIKYYHVNVKLMSHLPKDEAYILTNLQKKLSLKLIDDDMAMSELGVEDHNRVREGIEAMQGTHAKFEAVFEVMKQAFMAEMALALDVELEEQFGSEFDDSEESEEEDGPGIAPGVGEDPDAGGRGKKKVEDSSQIELETGQSQQRTEVQRSFSGEGNN